MTSDDFDTVASRTRRPVHPEAAGYGSLPRWINILAGAWLFLSAFLWPHTAQSQTNTAMVGLAILIVGLAGLYRPAIRFANTVLAIWLLASTFFLPHASAGSMWHDAIVAIVVFAASLAPSTTRLVAGRRHPVPVP